MDVNSGQVFIARDVNFNESTIYHQLLKTKLTKIAVELAEHDTYSEIKDKPSKPPKSMVQLPKAMIPSPQANVQPPKSPTMPLAINPIDDSDHDVTPPPETLTMETTPPKPRSSWRTSAIVSIAMMIE